MSFFHVWICILGTIYVIDKLIDTMLNIVIYSDSKNENTPLPEHAKSMYSYLTTYLVFLNFHVYFYAFCFYVYCECCVRVF